jgi:regulator of sirC expression with transglutaminase-like and TPR domain
MNPQSIKQLIAEKSPEEALEALSALIADNPGDASLLVERGKLYWRLDRRSESISDYERAAQLDPSGPAALLLEHTRAIMDFFNPDLLNP